MKDLCGTRVRKDDDGYHVFYITDSTPKDPDEAMQEWWPNLTYSVKVWDNSCAASEFRGEWSFAPELGQGALHFALQGPDGSDHEANSFGESRLGADNTKMGSELEEAVRRLDQANKELNEVWGDLADSQSQIKEQKADYRKADNDLLKMMRENETLKAELPSKSIANYKQSVRFEWGLRQMGQLSYEYGYRVT
ncbi:hypothetical protein GW17_00051273 [Ensete ventricosum]|nr:hypothetical protein GW17_00051273 [Ensete ventricosum]RZS08027.1 hypothetical protein BHM03_00038955 [Ensete ventricosum]